MQEKSFDHRCCIDRSITPKAFNGHACRDNRFRGKHKCFPTVWFETQLALYLTSEYRVRRLIEALVLHFSSPQQTSAIQEKQVALVGALVQRRHQIGFSRGNKLVASQTLGISSPTR